ncbi:MAG: GTPase HflX, partial [Dehalococcoidales bacterium]|nr:GTPase HflX [Dehalococcoidales bacterium]
SRGRQSAENSIEELAQLAGAAGAEVVGRIVQQLTVPSHEFYVGKGKLEELLALKDSSDFSVLILDDELTPNQQRNLEEALNVKVIDRAALILDIFARRARTHEGRLQVELAQHQYLLPRLAGQWRHLERLGGGIGTRGPGESQLETDRRLIRRKIQHLKEQTEDIRKHRALYRQRRQKSGIPVVALVGYTNAGKSTLLNALCQADVYADDRLFATLDPTTRRLTLPDRSVVLFTDTVGFIRKLPPTIISAFRATLEELTEASLLIHVVDLASPDAAEQCQAVEDILGELGLADRPRITVLNKIDMLLPGSRVWDEKSALDYFSAQGATADESTVPVSAVKGWGLAGLLELVGERLTVNSAVS